MDWKGGERKGEEMGVGEVVRVEGVCSLLFTSQHLFVGSGVLRFEVLCS